MQGPALLVRKSLADRVSLSAQYYVDAVSNASIDVVTTASPFKETRKAWDFSAQTVVRDGTLTLGGSRSTEPDYTANEQPGIERVAIHHDRANDKRCSAPNTCMRNACTAFCSSRLLNRTRIELIRFRRT